MLFHSEPLVTLTRRDPVLAITRTRHSYLKSAALLLENYYFHYLSPLVAGSIAGNRIIPNVSRIAMRHRLE